MVGGRDEEESRVLVVALDKEVRKAARIMFPTSQSI